MILHQASQRVAQMFVLDQFSVIFYVSCFAIVTHGIQAYKIFTPEGLLFLFRYMIVMGAAIQAIYLCNDLIFALQ